MRSSTFFQHSACHSAWTIHRTTLHSDIDAVVISGRQCNQMYWNLICLLRRLRRFLPVSPRVFLNDSDFSSFQFSSLSTPSSRLLSLLPDLDRQRPVNVTERPALSVTDGSGVLQECGWGFRVKFEFRSKRFENRSSQKSIPQDSISLRNRDASLFHESSCHALCLYAKTYHILLVKGNM